MSCVIFLCIFGATKKTDMFANKFISDIDIFDQKMTQMPVGEYPFDSTAAMEMPGGVIVLELNAYDYSMAQIARIVEDNNGKIWCSYVTPISGDALKMEVTLKIDQNDLTFIIRSFLRYGYFIKASYHGQNRHDDVLRNHYDQFMLYLNI